MHDYAEVYVEGFGTFCLRFHKISGFKLKGRRPIKFHLYQFLMRWRWYALHGSMQVYWMVDC